MVDDIRWSAGLTMFGRNTPAVAEWQTRMYQHGPPCLPLVYSSLFSLYFPVDKEGLLAGTVSDKWAADEIILVERSICESWLMTSAAHWQVLSIDTRRTGKNPQDYKPVHQLIGSSPLNPPLIPSQAQTIMIYARIKELILQDHGVKWRNQRFVLSPAYYSIELTWACSFHRSWTQSSCVQLFWLYLGCNTCNYSRCTCICC